MQKFKFPMEHLRVTQKANGSYSHKGNLAMDFGGKDTGRDKLYIPCDMIVKRARQNANGELYLESLEPVLFADGTTDYAHMLCIHDSEFNVVTNQVIKLGEHFYDEGGMGSGNANAFGNHVHIEAGKGKWGNCIQYPNQYGVYISENQYNLEKLFILGNDVVILDGQGYDWKRESDFETVEPQPTPQGVVNGIDTAKYQGDINYVEMLKDRLNVKFNILKTVGSNSNNEIYIDEKFEENYKQCKSNNIDVGVYLYSYAFNTAECDLELDVLLKALKDKQFEYPIWLDIEDKLLYQNCSKQQITDNIRYMYGKLTDLGYYVGLYTYTNFANNYIDMAQLRDIDVWIADYRENLGYTGDVAMWQYTSDGAVQGINARCDLNYCYKDYSFIKEQGLNGFKVIEPTDEVTKLLGIINEQNEVLTNLSHENEQLKDLIKLLEKTNNEYKAKINSIMAICQQ